MKGLFIPGITAKMFKDASLESIAELMAEGEIYDIDYQEPSEDCIRRAEALKVVDDMDIPEDMSVFEIKSHIGVEIGTLPPAQPKMGEWIFFKTVFDKYGCTVKCSSCHKRWKTYDEIRWKEENKFCPNCGRWMQEVEE